MTDHQPIPLALSPDGAEGRPGSNPSACPCAGSPTIRQYGWPRTWTDERVEELKRLYDLTGDAKLSMAQIADRLQSVDHRITRNAVVGQVHRLGLPKRGAAPSWRPGKYPAERKQRVRTRKPAPPLAPAPIVIEVLTPAAGGRIGTYTLSELTGRMCHGFPREVLDVHYFGPSLYCGAPCLPAEVTGVGPYCESCMRRFYQVRPANAWLATRARCG